MLCLFVCHTRFPLCLQPFWDGHTRIHRGLHCDSSVINTLALDRVLEVQYALELHLFVRFWLLALHPMATDHHPLSKGHSALWHSMTSLYKPFLLYILFTLVTESEVLVMQAPYSQYKVN